MRKQLVKTLWLWAIVAIASACSPATTTPPLPDLLADILARGRLVISNSADYPPQSEAVPGASRAAGTRCQPAERTISEVRGFDVDVAAEIARRLGVEPCFVMPTWTQVIGGSWADRWDIHIGSAAVTPERLKVLYFTQPYYTTPAVFFVHQSNTTFSKAGDLSGKRIGVCAGCTYEAYLKGTLALPGEKIDFLVKDAVVVGYELENPALEDLALGDGVRLDAALTGAPLGLSLMRQGLPIRPLGDPVFIEYLAAVVDKKSSKDPVSLVQKVSDIVRQMHADGTLRQLSQQYYAQDLTTAASQFDLAALGQLP